MLFSDYLDGLGGPSLTRSEGRRMRHDPKRDHLSTTNGRMMAERLVAQAEARAGTLDLPKKSWPVVVSTLSKFGADDWSRLRYEGKQALGLEPTKAAELNKTSGE